MVRRLLTVNRSACVGFLIVAVVGLLSFVAPLLGVPDPTAVDYGARLQSPTLGHLFGTDELGRDMLSRVIHGARTDLAFGLITATVSMAIGMLVGAFAGFYRGGLRETLVMRTVDALLALPFIVLVLSIVAMVGPGLQGAYIGIIAVSWTVYARVTYSEMLSLREREFILAARTLGFSDVRIVFRHALPNLLRFNIAVFMSDAVSNILALAALSYLGVGVQPPEPEWGALIAGGQGYLFDAPWISTLPGLVVVVVGVGFVLIGEWATERYGGAGEAAAR